MPVLKAHEADRFLDGLAGGRVPFCVMAYGPDRGLVADSLSRFAEATGVDRGDTLATVILDGASLQADPGRLRDELDGPGLFGGRRLVRLREAGNDRRLVAAVEGALEDPSPDAHLAIEGGDLKRGSALLKLFERSRAGTALPCYADDARALERTVSRMLDEAGKTLEPDARAVLLDVLGGDRLATRAEIEKLVLFMGEEPRIGVADIRAIVGDAGAVAADDAVDGALEGNAERFERAFARLVASKASPFLVLRDLVQQLQWLERAQEGASSASGAVRALEGFGPRLHFRRVAALKSAAARLSPSRTVALLHEAGEAVLETRRRADLETELVRALCLEIARAE